MNVDVEASLLRSIAAFTDPIADWRNSGISLDRPAVTAMIIIFFSKKQIVPHIKMGISLHRYKLAAAAH